MHVGEFYGTTNIAQMNTEEHILGLAFRRVKVGAGLELSFICTFSDILGHGCMDDLNTESSFGSQDACGIDVFGLFFGHVIHGCLCNQALADVRSARQE